MLSALTTLKEDELIGVTNQYLIKALPAYPKVKEKVFFIGVETNWWESFKVTTGKHKDFQYSSIPEELD